MKIKHSKPSLSRSAFLRTLALGAPFLATAGLRAENEPAATGGPAQVDLGNLRAFVELARSDIRTEKALLIAQNIAFTPDEAVEFWPVHREYEVALNKLLDERYATILDYAKNYPKMTDAAATSLARRVFALEHKRTDLKEKYFKKFCKVIPPVKAARFFQIEHQINTALDLQVAASLPLIK